LRQSLGRSWTQPNPDVTPAATSCERGPGPSRRAAHLFHAPRHRAQALPLGYLRVSTDEQADSGAGLAAQQEQLRRAFEYEGWELVEEIRDEGASGKDLDRPGLRRALELINAGEADGLVVAKLDRLTRSVVDFGDLLEWFDLAGAAFVALDLRLDTSTPTGAMVAHVLVVVAEWERRTIGQRTKDAMAAKRAAGEATGLPSILDNPELVARILELKDEGRSRTAIAEQLTREGWPTVRGGAEWRPSALQVVLGYQRPPRRRRRAELPTIPRRRRVAA
jgi:DNA invertase Pin-like site-specific DNA recombinase